jgi:hypothetical protein
MIPSSDMRSNVPTTLNPVQGCHDLPGADGLITEEKGQGEKSNEASRAGKGMSGVPGVPSLGESLGATLPLAGLSTAWGFLEVGIRTLEESDERNVSRAWAKVPMGEVAR